MKVLLYLILLLFSSNLYSQTSMQFSNNSSIQIDGYSNVKDFQCGYTGDITGVGVDYNTTDNTILLRNASITIPVVNLDCNNSRMNDDMMEC